MAAVSAALLQEETVVTEKLDGGNSCLHDGEVYVRTCVCVRIAVVLNIGRETMQRLIDNK